MESTSKVLISSFFIGGLSSTTLYIFIKYKGKDDSVIHQALDGKQRCTSLFEYINGDYKLHSSTPDVVVDGKNNRISREGI